MTNPREPLPDTELEDLVQRSAQLLERGSPSADVVLRALTLSVQKTLMERAPQQAPNMVDQMLQQQPGHPGYPPQPAPFYGPPGKTRPPGVPDPGAFGPQQF